ncbi:hypothetical protein AK812_SmicGene27582 [Symbiodinium microadriaticum]|uniref:DUF4116 domain-containing protein n=1 Tax=Symbiodinium microadriaticum TaxID=2951 RepID=A0A1Q9D6J7_SYMMI|nr:hypothetical protein AK812_SmicGene27582 [Symbiodinium microadriaticum]
MLEGHKALAKGIRLCLRPAEVGHKALAKGIRLCLRPAEVGDSFVLEDTWLAIEMLKRDGSILGDLPQEVVTAAVMQDGRSIMWASGQLKQDVPLALEAVRQDGRSLQFVAEALAAQCYPAVPDEDLAYEALLK